jgi:four helix bundle protein
MTGNLRVLDAAQAVVDEINELLDRRKGKFLYVDQIRESAGSITASIREAYGRRKGPERNQFPRYARGSAQETDERIRANYRANRLPAKQYWRLHHRLAAIVKMLNSLMAIDRRSETGVPRS